MMSLRMGDCSPARHWKMAECSESIGRIGARFSHHVFAAHHERLLVGQRQFLPGAERGHRRRQPGVAYQRVDHHVRIAARRDLGHGILSGVNLHVGAGQRIAQLPVIAFVGDDRRVRVEFPCLCREPLPVAVGRQHAHFE